LLISFVHY
jgi:hypothetical protein